MKKRDLSKIIIIILLIVISKLFVISPIEERKQLLEDKKSEMTKDIEENEKYKREVEAIKEIEEKRESKKLFQGRDDVIEIQNNINKIVPIQSIENIIELDENGVEVSNVSVKFVGTYEEIFKVVDAIKVGGISNYIKDISISKISNTTQQIPDIPDLNEKTQNTNDIKFECTLKISKN